MKYVVFDVDGVLLSEERCFDVSALVVDEWLRSSKYFANTPSPIDVNPKEEKINEIRQRVWCNDEILDWMKSYHINSNWDMVHAYMLGVIAIVRENEKNISVNSIKAEEIDITDLSIWVRQQGVEKVTPEAVFRWLQHHIPHEKIEKNTFFECLVKALEELFRGPCSWAVLNGPLYEMHTQTFQDWYLGNEEEGKIGFLEQETPLAPSDEIKSLFEELIGRGYILCIGTGRGMKEVEVPFKALGWWEYFDPCHIATADAAVVASLQLDGTPLDKPHPFTFRAAVYGVNDRAFSAYVETPELFIKENDTIYIIGDSPSDYTAAKGVAQSVMIATLTGLTGSHMRAYFEARGVSHIIPNVLALRSVLQ